MSAAGWFAVGFAFGMMTLALSFLALACIMVGSDRWPRE